MANNFEISFDPDCMIPSSIAAPDRGMIQARSYLLFSATATETSYTPAFRMPTAYTGSGTLKVDVGYFMATATSGGVAWVCTVEAVTDADALDLDSGTSFDGENTGTATVPATQGYLDVVTITLTNKGAGSSLASAVAAGDMVRLGIYRDHDHASDTATGDACLLYVTLYEEA